MKAEFAVSQRYAGKTILAPMVKIGTLPTRILALRYGADLVYSEEIIDWKFMRSKRVVNDIRNTIDYIDQTDGSVFFQTCPEETGKVILQIGTCDPLRALKVATMTYRQDDISGIDINMGCPKEFSIKGGMGAALLTEPKKIEAILTSLTSSLKIPVTCKVRVLPTIAETLKLCEMIESCGVAAIAVHGRTRYERPQHENRNHYLKEIAEKLSIPVIANGGSKEIRTHEDIDVFRRVTGCSSVMIARVAECNLSIFSKEAKEVNEVIRDFLQLAVQFNVSFTHAKYTVQMMMRETQDSEFGKKFLSTQVMAELCDLWNLSDYYKTNKLNEEAALTQKRKSDPLNGNLDSKKHKLDQNDQIEDEESDNGAIVIPQCVYIRGHYAKIETLPKTVLLNFVRTKLFSSIPLYVMTNVEKRFRAVVTVGGQNFRTDVWEKSKKAAEQAAAMACLKYVTKD